MKLVSTVNIKCFADFDFSYPSVVFITDERKAAENLVKDLNLYFNQHKGVNLGCNLFNPMFRKVDKQRVEEIYAKYFYEFGASLFINLLGKLSERNNIYIVDNLFSVIDVTTMEAKI